MTQLLLTPEQANLVSKTQSKIPVFLPDGSVAGYLSKRSLDAPDRAVFTPEEIAAAQQAAESPGSWYTLKRCWIICAPWITQERVYGDLGT